MAGGETHVVTGAFGFSGGRIARRRDRTAPYGRS
jgi:hypothetical protein